jgi:hypothetical protein
MHLTKKNWDNNDVLRQINSLIREIKSPYNDGYTAFECKKDFYEIKFLVDRAFKDLPTFSGEDEWLTKQEQNRIIKHLKS